MKKLTPAIFFTSVLWLFTSPNFAQTSQMKAELERTYNIKIHTERFTASSYANQYAKFSYLTAADAKELDRYFQYFYEEFRKYTPAWVKSTGLTSIYIVKNLVVMNQKRAAMPDLGIFGVYYDITYNSAGEKYQRHVVHHEYFHVIQYKFWGNAYKDNREWKAFNEKTFNYGAGGASAYGKNDSHIEHPRAGFVNGYSTYGLEEDQAEVYGYLFLQENSDKMRNWAKKDTILAKKIQYIENLIYQKAPDMKQKSFLTAFNEDDEEEEYEEEEEEEYYDEEDEDEFNDGFNSNESDEDIDRQINQGLNKNQNQNNQQQSNNTINKTFSISVGKLVLAYFKDGFYYPAKIKTIQGDNISVDYLDGDKGTLKKNQLREFDWDAGTSLECKFKNKFQRAKILSIGDMGIAVEFADKSVESVGYDACRVK